MGLAGTQRVEFEVLLLCHMSRYQPRMRCVFRVSPSLWRWCRAKAKERAKAKGKNARMPPLTLVMLSACAVRPGSWERATSSGRFGMDACRSCCKGRFITDTLLTRVGGLIASPMVEGYDSVFHQPTPDALIRLAMQQPLAAGTDGGFALASPSSVLRKQMYKGHASA